MISTQSLFTLTLALALTLTTGLPTTYHVSSTTGDDASNTGLTPTSPFLTLDHAVATSSPGDILVLSPGSYNISAPISPARSLLGTTDNPEDVIIDAEGEDHVLVVDVASLPGDALPIRVEGVTVTGADAPMDTRGGCIRVVNAPDASEYYLRLRSVIATKCTVTRALGGAIHAAADACVDAANVRFVQNRAEPVGAVRGNAADVDDISGCSSWVNITSVSSSSYFRPLSFTVNPDNPLARLENIDLSRYYLQCCAGRIGLYINVLPGSSSPFTVQGIHVHDAGIRNGGAIFIETTDAASVILRNIHIQNMEWVNTGTVFSTYEYYNGWAIHGKAPAGVYPSFWLEDVVIDNVDSAHSLLFFPEGSNITLASNIRITNNVVSPVDQSASNLAVFRVDPETVVHIIDPVSMFWCDNPGRRIFGLRPGSNPSPTLTVGPSRIPINITAAGCFSLVDGAIDCAGQRGVQLAMTSPDQLTTLLGMGSSADVATCLICDHPCGTCNPSDRSMCYSCHEDAGYLWDVSRTTCLMLCDDPVSQFANRSVPNDHHCAPRAPFGDCGSASSRGTFIDPLLLPIPSPCQCSSGFAGLTCQLDCPSTCETCDEGVLGSATCLTCPPRKFGSTCTSNCTCPLGVGVCSASPTGDGTCLSCVDASMTGPLCQTPVPPPPPPLPPPPSPPPPPTSTTSNIVSPPSDENKSDEDDVSSLLLGPVGISVMGFVVCVVFVVGVLVWIKKRRRASSIIAAISEKPGWNNSSSSNNSGGGDLSDML